MKRVIKTVNHKKIIIRTLKKADTEGVWKNFNQVVKEGDFLPIFTPVLSDWEKKSWYDNVRKEKEVVIIAEDPKLDSPDNVVGQCEITNSEWEASSHVGILGIIVNKEYRNESIGYHLIDAAIRESKKLNNKKKMILSCFSNNKHALHLYKSLGFNEVGIRTRQFRMNGHYYDEVMMDLWINDYLKNPPEFLSK